MKKGEKGEYNSKGWCFMWKEGRGKKGNGLRSKLVVEGVCDLTSQPKSESKRTHFPSFFANI
jgi:hypothetical protein